MKGEIRGLEYAVSALVHKLDILLTAEFGLRLLEVGRGLHISTPDHLGMSQDAFVTIRPVGWPKESRIYARFYCGANGWELYEGGDIRADHLPIPVSPLQFMPTSDGMGVRLKPVTGLQRQYVVQARAQLIASLQDDKEKEKAYEPMRPYSWWKFLAPVVPPTSVMLRVKETGYSIDWQNYFWDGRVAAAMFYRTRLTSKEESKWCEDEFITHLLPGSPKPSSGWLVKVPFIIRTREKPKP